MKDEAGDKTRLSALERVKPINACPTPTTLHSQLTAVDKCFMAFQHQDWIVNVIKYLHANPAAMSLCASVEYARESLCSMYSELKNI
jgi:hypothetical protein